MLSSVSRRPSPWLPFRRGPSLLDPGPLPSTVEVLRVPYAFSQTGLLTPEAFIRKARERGVRLDRDLLQVLHRRRLLAPFLQLHHRPVTTSVDFPTPGAWGTTGFITAAAADGRLTDPAARRYRPWPAQRDVNTIWYSTFQLLALPSIRVTLRAATHADPASGRWHLPPADRPRRLDAARSRALAVTLEVLAPRYLPRVMAQLKVDRDAADEMNAYVDDHDPRPLIELLRLPGERLATQAEELLSDAKSFDPLGSWHQVVRIGAPGKWTDLRYDALLAVEYRIAAEILLRCHDDMAAAGYTPPLPEVTPHWYHPHHDRLQVSARDRAETLHDFRLSGQPAVYLALEGQTEIRTAELALADLFGLDGDANLVRLVDLDGVDHDLALLARAVAVPRLDFTGDRLATARSPLVGLIVAVDPESRYKTCEQQAKHRANMIATVLKSLPKHARTDTMRDNIDHLIDLRTWGEHSFEFAHFTDLQLARALRRLAGRAAPPLAELRAALADYRDRHRNLDKLWADWPARITKPDLAATLWPILRRRATSRSRQPLPPIVDVVAQAVALAHQLRHASGMAVEPDPAPVHPA
ncbi:MAG TPA: hypothetical protein VNA20_10540 [Frankiaceae bacterium]|nr:hypothetical protein [Frankiaceae bacterium]